MADLTDVIEDSISDAVSEPIDEVPSVETPSLDAPVEAAPEGGADPAADVAADPSSEVQSPAAAAQPDAEEDEFAKKYGLPGQSITGRENRIPYSRVKKIVEKAEKDAISKAQKDWEGTSTPKITELSTKVQDYEGRLQRVAQFEQVMTGQPNEFLRMLSQLPAYKDFFDFVGKAIQQAQAPAGATSAAANAPAGDEMPQPDEKLGDGTMVYSMDGLKKLQDWQASQIEARLSKQYESKLAEATAQFAPIKQKFDAEQQLAAIIPQIQKQIEEARKWPHFSDNEAAITAALQADRNLSLEGAYRQILQTVVLPKLTTDRESIRQSVLDEIKRAPVGSASPVRGTTGRPNPQTPTGPRSMEQIIKESMEAAGLNG